MQSYDPIEAVFKVTTLRQYYISKILEKMGTSLRMVDRFKVDEIDKVNVVLVSGLDANRSAHKVKF